MTPWMDPNVLLALKQRLANVQAQNPDLALPGQVKPNNGVSPDQFPPQLPQDVVSRGAPPGIPPMIVNPGDQVPFTPGPQSPDVGNQNGLQNPDKKLLKKIIQQRQGDLGSDDYNGMVK